MSLEARLLEKLRRVSAEPQPKVDEPKTLPPELSTWRHRFDGFLPLVLALSRSMLVRNICAGTLGAALLTAGCCRGTTLQVLMGLGLLVASQRGLPGATEFRKVETEAGFYAKSSGVCASRNQKIREAMQAFMASFVPCPWQQSGELCTILPYSINAPRFGLLKYERIWLAADDGEVFASDFVFPPGGFDPTRPIVVLLTGLAPSQHWTEAAGFISDAAGYLTCRANMTVVILVARGTMDTRVNANLFHGARVTDFRRLLETMDPCLKEVASDAGVAKPAVFAAGYSMGAIILANYCGHYGKDALL
ncbi:EMB8, partial [Symbiodinium pilosum]